jgi:curved DNA-binding protein CbpA
MTPDYYAILEISPEASAEEIKKQYHFLAQAWHPDKFSSPEHKKRAEDRLKEINAAYEVLSERENFARGQCT